MGTPESRLHRLRQRGQGNFELAANYDYTPTKCCRKWCSLLSGWVSAVF